MENFLRSVISRRYGRSGNRKAGRKQERMTFFDKKNQYLNQRQQKEIPIFKAIIKKIYKRGLNYGRINEKIRTCFLSKLL